MAEVLSQNEIEALLSAMTTVEDESPSSAEVSAPSMTFAGGGSSSPGGRSSDGRVFLPLRKRRRAAAEEALQDARFRHSAMAVSYEPYDFRRPDKLSKEHLRSLQLLHEAFANQFSSSLAGYLRATVQIDLVSVEQVPYDEYMKSISASLLNVLNVTPLAGQMIFETDFGILFSMIDRLLGGKGAAGKVQRDLTDIERMLAENIVNHALEDLTQAWSTVTKLQFEVASTETNSQFVQIVPGNDTVVLLLFEVHMGDYQGAMSLCVPYLLIKPILGRLSAQRWLSSNKKRSALYARQLAERLRTTRVPCIARLGTADLTVADIVNLQLGQVIPMKIPSEDEQEGGKRQIASVDILVGDTVKFRGKTGLHGKNLAVQIESVVGPSPELIAHKETN